MWPLTLVGVCGLTGLATPHHSSELGSSKCARCRSGVHGLQGGENVWRDTLCAKLGRVGGAGSVCVDGGREVIKEQNKTLNLSESVLHLGR